MKVKREQLCGPIVIGCEHLEVGCQPQVILAEDNNAVSHAMCTPCADWFDDNAEILEPEQVLASGNVGFVCLHCLEIPTTMEGPGFWLLNADGTYRRQELVH
jgi:hypothetical protein